MNKVDSEVLAVISAAITLINEKSGKKLIIKSFRRIPQKSPIWNTTGRIENLN